MEEYSVNHPTFIKNFDNYIEMVKLINDNNENDILDNPKI